MAATASYQYHPHHISHTSRTAALGHGTAAAAVSFKTIAPSSAARSASRNQLTALDTSITSYRSSSSSLAGTPRSASAHAKLHKKGPSASSLPPPPSPSTYGTPVTTHHEPFPDVETLPSASTTPKLNPFQRKISKEDQGRLDLSKPVTENNHIPGLGIHDFVAKTPTEIGPSHVAWRGTHTRTTSVGSQISTASASRANQPFVHPMRQTPRPFTPTASYPASIRDGETDESDDIVEDDFKPAHGYRSRRSMSISSTHPTPLSQSHTAERYARVPSSLSLNDVQPGDINQPGKLRRPSRPRQGTDRSVDSTSTPGTRVSLEKAFSIISRRSESDPKSRDDRIRAARRKFEEKEASKDLKRERDASKRRETRDKVQIRELRKSESADPVTRTTAESRLFRSRNKIVSANGRTSEKLHATSYDETRPTHSASLPRAGKQAGMSDKPARTRHEHKSSTPQGSWVRFSAWLHTRMMSCGLAK